MFFKKCTYLDFASGALPNPSSPHEEGRRAHEALEAARASIARLVESKPDDVLCTSGATEANALAILGLAKPGAHLLYLPSAHASIVENMRLAAARFGVHAEALPLKDCRVDSDALAKLIRPETVLVSMDAVCGETGIGFATREVRRVLPSYAYLHVDASQAVFTEKLARAHFGADLLTLDGGKLGVRGAGALVAHRTIPLAPLYGGGGQERGLRSGTEHVEAIGRFAAALAAAANHRETFRASAQRLRADLLDRIAQIPGLVVNEAPHPGRNAPGAPHILNLSLPGRDTDYLVALLDEAGFAVSTRSACETDSQEGSRAVLALTGDWERARSTLRVSWGPDTAARDLVRFARALIEAVRFVDSTSAS